MTKKYKILSNYIKDLSSETPNVESFLFTKDNISKYEKSFGFRQHDHIILDDDDIIEFCDPRIQSIKNTVEEMFDVKIKNHSLYFFGEKNKK